MFRRLSRLGWQRGVLGGGRGWTAVWVGVAVLRLVRRSVGRQEEHLSTERLRPGQAVLITALGPRPTRREKRRAARSPAG